MLRLIVLAIVMALTASATAATIELSTDHLAFDALEAAPNPIDQTITITNPGGSDLHWTADPNEPYTWLTISPASGTVFADPNFGPDYADMTISIDSSALTAGTHIGGITISEPAAENNPRCIAVTVDVQGPILDVSDTSGIYFSADLEAANPADKTITISNPGGGTLNWQTSINPQADWLTVIPGAGSLTAAQQETITLTADITDLDPGLHSCVLTISDPTAENSPQTITVSLDIQGPILNISDTSLFFAAELDGSNPSDQTIIISNPGAGTLNWQISIDPQADWLTIIPPAGSLTAAQPQTVTISADITGLAEGSYTCDLTISDPTAENSPQTVAVYLYIYSGPSLFVPSEYLTIQDAIDAASDGDTVIIAPGTYTGTGNHDIDFKGKAITVQGGAGPENTIIDCQSQSRGFYFHSGEVENSILSGLTIKNGLAWHGDGDGGGIKCVNSSPTITNCIISSSTAWGRNEPLHPDEDESNLLYLNGHGGGMYFEHSSSIISNTLITNNTAHNGFGGGVHALNSNLLINDCPITDNYSIGHCVPGYLNPLPAKGGGIYIESSSVTISDSDICNNTVDDDEYYDYVESYGGGIYLCNESDVSIANSIISDNHADSWGHGGGIYGGAGMISNCTISNNIADESGGGVRSFSGSISNSTISENQAPSSAGLGGCSGSITNCIIANNTADVLNRINGNGGGLSYCNGSITNCTIVNNSAKEDGGGLLSCNGSITNCIIWNNTSETSEQLNSSSIPTYSCIQDWTSGGQGNITDDPLFVSGPLGNFYLSQIAAGQGVTSLCVDAGSDTAANLELSYLTTRTDDTKDWGIVDMGYHYPSSIERHKNYVDFAILAKEWQVDNNVTEPVEPAAHWAFDEGRGTIAYDTSGNDHHATLVNMDYNWAYTLSGYAVPGRALYFEGMDNFVQATGYKGIEGANPRTCSAWINTTETGRILTILSWGAAYDPGERWGFRVLASGYLNLKVGGGLAGSTYLTDGQWHHVAVVFDNDGSPYLSDARLYVDGVEENTTVTVDALINTIPSPDVRIGSYLAFEECFKGLIDDVRIYSAALSDESIDNIYNDLPITETYTYCSQPPAADMTGDCRVDLDDLMVMAQHWLITGQ